MMNKEVLIELMQKARDLGIAELIIGHDRVEIRTGERRATAAPTPDSPAAPPPTPRAPIATPDPWPAAGPAAAPVTPSAASIEVRAPIPGTLYVAPARDAQQRPLPLAGAAVREGDVIALIEAMKMFNEVFAPADGTLDSLPLPSKSPVKVGDVIATLAGTSVP